MVSGRQANLAVGHAQVRSAAREVFLLRRWESLWKAKGCDCCGGFPHINLLFSRETEGARATPHNVRPRQRPSHAGITRIGFKGLFSALRAVEHPWFTTQIESQQHFFENYMC